MRNENLPVPTNNESELHVAAELNPLAELRTSLDSEEQAAPSGMNVRDVFFMLLRHKWKIILFGLAGFGIAAQFTLPLHRFTSPRESCLSGMLSIAAPWMG